MTRTNQTLRAWISREKPTLCWKSNVSHKGKVHILRTPTRIRKAAREFNTLHTLRILAPRLGTPNSKEIQAELNF